MHWPLPRLGRYVWGLLFPVIPLCLISLMTLHAISSGTGDGALLAPMAARQLIFISAGLAAMMVTLAVGYERLGRWSFVLFVICLGLLVLLVLDRWIDLPLIDKQRNARRWIRLGGIQLQPSEMMKIVYVLALAWYLRYRRNYRTLGGLIAPFAITLVPMALILKQPDLGTVLLFLPVLFAMLFVAGAKLKHLAVIVLLGVLCAPIFWLKIHDYQRLRITGVLLQSPTMREYFEDRPELWDSFRSGSIDAAQWRRELTNWSTETGFQLVHSKAAIGSGGVRGQGWGEGVFVEHGYLLPERENDFIFPMVANQWGLVGALVLILCYVWLILLGFDVATLTNDPFGRLLAVGLSTMLAVQTFTNLFMTVGLGPVTGVTLPFVSAGGSSLVASFICVGLLLSVAYRRRMMIANRPFEFEDGADHAG